MKKSIITLFLISCICFAISGCAQSTWLYRVNVQQGNVINADMVQQLRVGMTREMVCDVLGPPILSDAFNDNRWTYTYFFKGSRTNKIVQKNLVLHFRNGRVSSINTVNIK